MNWFIIFKKNILILIVSDFSTETLVEVNNQVVTLHRKTSEHFNLLVFRLKPFKKTMKHNYGFKSRKSQQQSDETLTDGECQWEETEPCRERTAELKRVSHEFHTDEQQLFQDTLHGSSWCPTPCSSRRNKPRRKTGNERQLLFFSVELLTLQCF